MNTLTTLLLVSLQAFLNKQISHMTNFQDHKNHPPTSSLIFLANKQTKEQDKFTTITRLLENRSFSFNQLKKLSRYERFYYRLHLFTKLVDYDTKFEKFIRNNWRDTFNLTTKQKSIFSMFIEDIDENLNRSMYEMDMKEYKSLGHDMLTGRLLLGHKLVPSFFSRSNKYRNLFRPLQQKNTDLGFHPWRKNFNVPTPKRLNFLKKNRRTPNWLTTNHKAIVKSLKSTPVFIPVNGFQQPILGVPFSEYYMNAFDRIHFFVFEWFLWKNDELSLPVTKGFVFFNPQDSSEFLSVAQQSSPRSSARYAPLQLFAINLGLAYKWSRTSAPRVQFRFVPDIKEVGDLVSHHQYNKNIKCHTSQIINRKKFKGVPIYSIEPVVSKINNKQVSIEYAGDLHPIEKKRKMLFTSLDTVYKVWENFREQYSEFQLPKQPNILVYNLEDYIQDCESILSKECQDFRIVPNEQSYLFARKLNHEDKKTFIHFNYKYKLLPSVRKLKLWSKYVFWSLTTTERPDW
uniref:hypothetical protein n=1 Tax=Pseudoerythrocladia kornmannii TaxID=753682 RepID=UPI001FCDF4DB|nr:hypothetical protein MW575_pgp056 [Pseudoerythrocladia kornmannii]UNJ16804.1 hypothetical protein [Pseudoerythrocladia kornmannii]